MSDKQNIIDAQIHDLRDQEAEIDTNNRIADMVIYELQNIAEPSNHNMRCWYKAAIDKFGDRVPVPLIRKVVDATVVKEMLERRDREAIRATNRDRSGRMFPVKHR